MKKPIIRFDIIGLIGVIIAFITLVYTQIDDRKAEKERELNTEKYILNMQKSADQNRQNTATANNILKSLNAQELVKFKFDDIMRLCSKPNKNIAEIERKRDSFYNALDAYAATDSFYDGMRKNILLERKCFIQYNRLAFADNSNICRIPNTKKEGMNIPFCSKLLKIDPNGCFSKAIAKTGKMDEWYLCIKRK